MSFVSTVLPHLPASARKVVRRVRERPLAYRLAHGAFWSLFGAVIARVLGLAAVVIVARVLGKAGYGQFGIVQSTMGMFGVFAGFGLGQTATKYVAELRDREPERAGKILGLAGVVALVTGIGMAAVLYGFAPWLASRTLNAPELAPLLRIGALILLLEALNGAQMGALSGFEAFKVAAKIDIIAGIASFPCMLAGVYLGGLEGSVWALAATRAIQWILNHRALRREADRAGVPLVFRGIGSELPILWRYSLPSMLSGVMVMPALWICNTMLVNQARGYEQLGIFQAANSFRTVLFFVGNTLGAPLLPMLANMLGSGLHHERLARINILSSWFLGAVPALFLFGVPEVAQAIYGRDYAGREFIDTFMLTVFCACIVVYKQGLARVLSARGLMWWGTLSNFVWATTLIVCTWLLVSKGAFGYALAWAIAFVLNTVLFVPLYIRKNLAPRGTILSVEAGLIWLLLMGSMALSFLRLSLGWRLAAIPILGAMLCWLFWRLLTQGSPRAVEGGAR